MNKIVLDGLPKKKGKCGYIDWLNSTGCQIPFVYESYTGVFVIKRVLPSSSYVQLLLEYNGREEWISKNALTNLQLKKVLNIKGGNKCKPTEYTNGQIIKDENRHIKLLKQGHKTIDGNRYRGFIYECQCCGHKGFKTIRTLRKGTGCVKGRCKRELAQAV